ncbi:MAG: phosphoenolpyruvate hydrolase family protein [Pirellulaceae bacterium]
MAKIIALLGSIGARTAKTLEQCVPIIDAIAVAAKNVRDDVILLCHAGPIAQPHDAAFILDWLESRKLGKLEEVGFRHLLRVLVSNTGHFPTHAVTIINGASGAMIGPRMAGRTHG